MYPVSKEYQKAISESSRSFFWTGMITTKAGKKYTFGNKDIVKGSGYISRQCSGSSEIELGSVYAAELGISLFSDIDRYSLEDASITVSFHLKVGDAYEEVPMGIFYIAEANRKIKTLELKAYDAMLNLDKTMGELVSKISDPTVTAVGNFAKRVPSYLISFIVVIMSAYFFTVQKEDVIAWLKKVSPPSVTKRMTLVSDNLKYAVGGYFKAQLKIMGVIFLILWISFAVTGVHYAILVALLIAILDFFPFFGTGTALIPWAVYKFLIGNIKAAVILLVIYTVTQLVRQLIQPRMLGKSMGMNPLVTLILLYLGYKVYGVIGMIFAVPIGMILVNMISAGAFDYILNDVKILVEGILGLRED